MVFQIFFHLVSKVASISASLAHPYDKSSLTIDFAGHTSIIVVFLSYTFLKVETHAFLCHIATVNSKYLLVWISVMIMISLLGFKLIYWNETSLSMSSSLESLIYSASFSSAKGSLTMALISGSIIMTSSPRAAKYFQINGIRSPTFQWILTKAFSIVTPLDFNMSLTCLGSKLGAGTAFCMQSSQHCTIDITVSKNLPSIQFFSFWSLSWISVLFAMGCISLRAAACCNEFSSFCLSFSRSSLYFQNSRRLLFIFLRKIY